MVINKETKLLIIAPHLDDEAINCGGIIGKAKKEGAEVLVVYCAVGGNRQLVTKQTDVKTRLKELKDVEKFGKFKTRVLNIDDWHNRMDSVSQLEIINQIEDVIEEFEPTIIVLPSSVGYHQDHRAIFDACIAALRPTPKRLRHFTPFVLESFEPYFWINGEAKVPNLFLDLSERYKGGSLLDFKLGLYRCHVTQVRKDPFPRSPENLKRMAEIWGKEIGVNIAEAYHILRAEIW